MTQSKSHARYSHTVLTLCRSGWKRGAIRGISVRVTAELARARCWLGAAAGLDPAVGLAAGAGGLAVLGGGGSCSTASSNCTVAAAAGTDA